MNLYTEEIKLKEENRLFYSDTGETKELGCIGHLRGDFGHDGKEFWTTWFPHENHEKNDEVFREIFDRVAAKGITAALSGRCEVKYVPPPREKDFNAYLCVMKAEEIRLGKRRDERA